MGIENYKENKGFSTDMYLRVRKPNGEEVLDEISLKKSKNVKLEKPDKLLIGIVPRVYYVLALKNPEKLIKVIIISKVFYIVLQKHIL